MTFVNLQSSLNKNTVKTVKIPNTNTCNEMSFRGRVLGLVEVVLRVPPLFVIDEILKIGLGLTELSEHDLSNFGEEEYEKAASTYNNVTTSTIPYDPVVYRFILMSVIRLLLSTLG